MQSFINGEIQELNLDLDTMTPYVGLDFGYRDPLACVVCYISPDKEMIYIADEIYKTEVPINQIPSLLNTLPEISKRRAIITADSAEPRTIQFLKDNNFNVRGAEKGKDSILEGISWLSGKHIYINPKCINAAREIMNYRYDRDSDEVIQFDKFMKNQEDHAIDALRYALRELMKRNVEHVSKYRSVIRPGII